MTLGERVVLTVVVQRSEIDVRGGMSRIHVKHLQVSIDGLILRGGIFFQLDPVREQVGNIGNHQLRPVPRWAGYNSTFAG